MEPKELSILCGGNEISQFFSMGKSRAKCVDRAQSQPKKIMSLACEKIVTETPPRKLTPPPLSAESEDWAILQPRRPPMKRSFMQKCPFKMNVEGLSAQGVVKVRWLQVDVSCAFVFFLHI